MLALRRFDQQIRAFVLLRARADSSRDGSKPQGPSSQGHATARGPSHFHHRSKMNDCYSGAIDEIGDEGNMAAPAKRIDGIDFWRGLALLMIFIDHVPENVFQHVTQKNFGFSDAAELFVFLAGVSVALAYGTRFFEGETVGAVRAVLRRAFTLYWVQILISLLIIAIFVGAADLWHEDDLLEDADAVVSNPLQTTAGILALLHQLENANILPLYIALLLMTPLLLVLARRDDRLMLAASAGIYLAARVFSLNLSTWPVEGTWFFNPIAWQLIFAIGIFAGRRIKRGGITYDARLFAACLAIVAIAAVVRTDAFGYASGLWQNVHDVLDCGKTDLGFARLVHFLALAYIVYHSGLTGLMRRTRAFAPLCLIGRYGLPVFATGTVLSAMGEVVETRAEAFSHQLAFGTTIVVGGILMHYFVARGLAAWRDKSRARQSMMNRARTLQTAAPLSLQKSAIVLWSGTSPPISPIYPSRESHPRAAEMQSGQNWCVTIVTDHSICRPSGGVFAQPHKDDVWRIAFSRDGRRRQRSTQDAVNMKSANGMVRPCSCPASDKLARGAKTRSTPWLQTAQSAIAVIGIDIGKNSFHVVGLDESWRNRAASEVVAWPGGSTLCQYAAVPDRHGGLRRCASSQSQAQGAWARCAADAGEVRATLFQGTEERLPRRGGDRRGGAAADDEVRGDQDRRSARPAGAASGA